MEAWYGLLVSVPTRVEPEKNSTLAIDPSESEAEAARLIDAGALKVEPEAGDVMDTVGTWLGSGVGGTSIEPTATFEKTTFDSVPRL
jgi:hypothetical protein